jgi:hypothetical protein
VLSRNGANAEPCARRLATTIAGGRGRGNSSAGRDSGQAPELRSVEGAPVSYVSLLTRDHLGELAHAETCLPRHGCINARNDTSEPPCLYGTITRFTGNQAFVRTPIQHLAGQDKVGIQENDRIIQASLRARKVKQSVTSYDSNIRSDLSIRQYGLFLAFFFGFFFAIYYWHIQHSNIW